MAVNTNRNLKKKKPRISFLGKLLIAMVICAVAALGIVGVVAYKNIFHPFAASSAPVSSTAFASSQAGYSVAESSIPTEASIPTESSIPMSSAAVPATSKAASRTSSPQTATTGKPKWIEVDTAAQMVRIHGADDKVIKQFICSTGLPGSDTPIGTFHIQARGKSFFSEKYQEGGYYWLKFYGNYWFHSIVFDKNRNIIPTEAAKLGSKASHGCVRSSIEDEKWMYDNIPTGTKVIIH